MDALKLKPKTRYPLHTPAPRIEPHFSDADHVIVTAHLPELFLQALANFLNRLEPETIRAHAASPLELTHIKEGLETLQIALRDAQAIPAPRLPENIYHGPAETAPPDAMEYINIVLDRTAQRHGVDQQDLMAAKRLALHHLKAGATAAHAHSEALKIIRNHQTAPAA